MDKSIQMLVVIFSIGALLGTAASAGVGSTGASDGTNLTPVMSPSSGSGPGGRINVSEDSIVARFYDIDAGDERRFEFGNSTVIQEIILRPDERLDDYNFTVRRRHPSETGRPWNTVAERAFRVTQEPANASVEARMIFRLSKKWAADHDMPAKNVSLYRARWEEIPTEHTGYFQYSATVENFSTFVLAGQKPGCYFSEPVKAAGPGSCETFENWCSVPSNYEEVDSCRVWRQRKDARELIRSTRNKTDTAPAKEILAKAESELKRDNFSGAENLADRAIDVEIRTEKRNAMLHAVLLILLVISLLYSGIKFYSYRKKASTEEELEEISETVADGIESGRLGHGSNLMDMMEKAESAIARGDIDQANAIIQDMKKAVREDLE